MAEKPEAMSNAAQGLTCYYTVLLTNSLLVGAEEGLWVDRLRSVAPAGPDRVVARRGRAAAAAKWRRVAAPGGART